MFIDIPTNNYRNYTKRISNVFPKSENDKFLSFSRSVQHVYKKVLVHEAKSNESKSPTYETVIAVAKYMAP